MNQQNNAKQDLYFADFLYAEGVFQNGALPSVVFYADDDNHAKSLVARMSVTDIKEPLIICRYNSKHVPTIISRFGDIEPAKVQLSILEKQQIGLTLVLNIDTSFAMNMHTHRIKKHLKVLVH